ncbi:MacB-like periplasmic core domain protein [Xanthomonas sp. GW]|uniref:ADOP family duplicated permease n=1 Tax=Xanthomonas sp. GW TaxID=2724121 RepID=UPI00163B013C|nr:ADOP family duplicated permease [Xanthomonas sp. GW]QNH22278.1 MacB-like periplasmic core domain protein [Xanthomonas sp. GW]
MSAAMYLAEARQSWRALARKPGYLLLAVLTLALGVATTTAVFALLDQALLKPLPFPQPQRLVTLGLPSGGHNVAAPGYYPVLRRMPSMQAVGIVRGFPVPTNIARGDASEVIAAISADEGFLRTLGMPMAAGRNFTAEESRPGGPQAVILAHRFWQRYFGGDPAAVGRTLQVEGKPVQIVGVLPADFPWAEPFDLIRNMQPDLAATNLSTNEIVVARLRPGVGVAAASAQTAVVIKGLLRNSPYMDESWWRSLQREPPNALLLQDSLYTSYSGNTLWLFFAAAACVLLIAAINLTSLMLLRALGRSHDSAVRAALGAPWLRLSLPALAEGVLIGALGSLAGLALAWLGLRLLGGWVPLLWMRGEAAHLTGASALFALLAGGATAVVAAALGIVRGRRRNLVTELADGGRGGWSLQAGRLGRTLVIAQVAIAVMLLIGAALFTRTLQKLAEVPMGFESRSAVVFTLAPVKERYATVHDAVEQTRRIVARLQQVPGIERVGVSTNPPATTQLSWSVEVDGMPSVNSQYRLATPQFLQVFRIPLLAGRGIAEGDVAGAEKICVVSATFAERYLHGHALGKIVTVPDDGGNNRLPMRVVGVVGDVRHAGPAQPPEPMVYQPLAQMSEPMWQIMRSFGALTYAVRLHAGALGADERALRAAIDEVAPQQPIADLQPMQALVASTTGEQKLNLLLVGLFAALALLLAAVGLYAVMAVAVAARQHEFGVRAALGAPPARLRRQVLREAGLQIGIGLLLGLGVAMALSRLLQRFLFEVRVADPLAIGAVLLVLAAAGLLAALAPAQRAARVPPMQALRAE